MRALLGADELREIDSHPMHAHHPKHVKHGGEGETTADDPDRSVWHSTSCSYWTDNWQKLRLFGPGIPCCPCCGVPGFYGPAKSWFDSAAKFEQDGHPRYVEFLNAMKERCVPSMMGAYERTGGDPANIPPRPTDPRARG